MKDTLSELLQQLKIDKKKRRKLTAILLCLSFAVAGSVTWAMHITGESQSAQAYCGYEEHIHTKACRGTVYYCGLEEREADPGHTHTDACYTERNVLTCTAAEHSHSQTCYGPIKYLACTDTAPGHVHGDSCYKVRSELICSDAHHTDACYTESSAQTCVKTEHTHSKEQGCYTEAKELNCAEEHEHTDACYVTRDQLVCSLEEHTHSPEADCVTTQRNLTCTLQHEHSETCFRVVEGLVCTVPEHTHTADQGCYGSGTEFVLACGQEERAASEGHKHSDACGKEEKNVCGLHAHTLSCYSNPAAVESAWQWAASVANAELNGEFRHDLLAIAETQVGYIESPDNYVVGKGPDGEEFIAGGYTRYGAWYDPHYTYEAWCAMFISFCMSYANISSDMIPYAAGCEPWTLTLKANGIYAEAEGYMPKPGDIVFFDFGGSKAPDHVAIVSEVKTPGKSGEEDTYTILTIEGNLDDAVTRSKHESDDGTILGYCNLDEAYKKAVAKGLVTPKNSSDTSKNSVGRSFGSMSGIEKVAYVDSLIALIPDEDELMEEFAALDEAGDEAAMDAYYLALSEKVGNAGSYYQRLNAAEKAAVAKGEYLLTLCEMLNIQLLATNVEILNFEVSRVSPTPWVPSDPQEKHEFKYRIDYNLSGTNIQAGEVEFRIPLHILKDRSGNWADEFKTSVPERSQVGATANVDFAYYIEGDEVVIYNVKAMPSAQTGFIDFSYTTTEDTFSYTDNTTSTNVNGTMSAGDKSRSDSADAVSIDTGAVLNNAVKDMPEYYSSWDTAWGPKPQGADDRLYLVWPIKSDIAKATQPYTLEITDNFTDFGGRLEAISFDSKKTWTSANGGTSLSVNNQTSYGLRRDYVLVSYDRAQAAAELTRANQYWIFNTVNVKLTPGDNIDPPTQKQSSQAFLKVAPTYRPPAGDADADKNGLYGKNDAYVEKDTDISSYALLSYLRGTANLSLRYDVHMGGFPYPYTVPDGTDITQEANVGEFGKVKVKYSLEDKDVYIQPREYDPTVIVSGTAPSKLNAEDYEFASVEWFVKMYKAEFDAENKVFVYAPNLLSSNSEPLYDTADTIELYVILSDGTEAHAATFNLLSNQYTFTDSTYIRSAAQDWNTGLQKLEFNNSGTVKVTGYRIETENAYYRTYLSATPTLTLKMTDHVAQILTGDPSKTAQDVKNLPDSALSKLAVTNEATASISRYGYSEKIDGTDFVKAVVRESELKKDVVYPRNDSIAKRYTITWRLQFAETMLDDTGVHSVYQSGGTFFDLLPISGTLDRNSVRVWNNSGELAPGQYTVEVEENYRGTGRQMVRIKVLEPTSSDYSCEFDTIHTWDRIQDYGKEILNSAAFESDNDDIADGRPDDGGEIREKNVMDNLTPDDPTDDDATVSRFTFSETDFEINALIAANTGLTKTVRAEDDPYYTLDTVVHNNGIYNYYIRFENDNTTSSRNLMFFDSLEHFIQSEDQRPFISDYRGTLLSVDVSQMNSKGIVPKLYVKADPAMNLNNQGIDESYDFVANGWILVTPGMDLSPYKVVAVDARYKADGSVYTLPPGESVSFVIYMRAPLTATVTPDDYTTTRGHDAPPGSSLVDDPVTLNNIYGYREAEANGEFQPGQLTHQDFTRVVFRSQGDLSLHKVSAADPSVSVKGATYRLTGTSHYGDSVNKTAVTDAGGNISFENIPMSPVDANGNVTSRYTLTETASGSEWLLNNTVYEVAVDANGNVTVTANGAPLTKDANNRFILSDEPRIHTKLEFIKVNGLTGTPITYDPTDASVTKARFRIVGNSDYNNSVNIEAEADENGVVSFADVEKGSYEIYELVAPDGFNKPDKPLKLTVDKDGIATIYRTENGSDVPLDRNQANKYLVSNNPPTDVRFFKTSSYGANVYLTGAKFMLTGTSDNGKDVTMTAVSGSAAEKGLVQFKNLDPGTYDLKEISVSGATDNSGNANLSYEPDPDNYEVTVNSDGSYKIYKVTVDAAGVKTRTELPTVTVGQTGTQVYKFENSPKKGKIEIIKNWIGGGKLSYAPGDIDLTVKTTVPTPEDYGGKTVKFNADIGSFGASALNTVSFLSGGARISGTYAIPTAPAGKVFDYWYKAGDTSKTPVTVNADGWPDGYVWGPNETDLELVAVYKDKPSGYAVKLGNVDTANNQLTFLPALGGNYVNSYKAHAEGTTCIHWDSWDTIVANLSGGNAGVYSACLTNGCTKNVPLDFTGMPTFTGTTASFSGDGPSVLYTELKNPNSSGWPAEENLRWASVDTGFSSDWSQSRVRAMLNGATPGVTYAQYDTWYVDHGATDYNASNCLLAAFPETLRNHIVPRTIQTKVAGSNTLVTTSDKLWLLAYTQTEDSMYIGSLSDTTGYNQTGAANYYWLRTADGATTARRVSTYGTIPTQQTYNANGIAPGFVLGG